MRVVILAAGLGIRMKGETPKPLIEINGRVMVANALELATEVSERPLLLAANDVLESTYSKTAFSFTGINVDHVQSGAAMSLLAAAGQLDEREPVMVMDCDVLLKPGTLRKFADWAQIGFNTEKIKSALLCFKPKDDSSRYSFVREVQADNRADYPIVVDVWEKVRVSNIASCGVHVFNSWQTLRVGICAMVYLREQRDGEYYLAPTHNRIGGTSYMMTDWFQHVGTKEELAKYEATK